MPDTLFVPLRWLAACLIISGLPDLADGQAVSPASNRVILRNDRFAVVLDAQSGGLAELRWGEELLTQPLGTIPPLDIKQDETWIVGNGGVRPKLLNVRRPGPGAAVATIAAGDWQVELHYELDPSWPMLTRWARLTWKGKQPTKLKGFWLGTPPLVAATAGKVTEGATASYYYFPGVYPPQRYAAEEFRVGARHSTSQSLSPLIAQLSPQRSVLWICDELTSASDHTSATVTEMPGGFRVVQHFNAAGRVRPGEVQEIGSACLWLIEGDGEAALRRIHDWMRKRGHVPPADRPEWFRDAVIYSFHPGGTIGSGFRDLGGFRAATKLLDHIAALGCNAIWIMPIEDAGPYQPRDYYKFQDGLGTAEEYRGLVARAHQLGLHVLQDCVPHGGRNDSPRAHAHPEWLAQEEDGSTLSYWCNDFNWPSWRNYMADVARHYVKEFGVDGYRVDAVGGSKIVNWNPAIPYGRASFAQLQGGLSMLHALRAAVKQQKPAEGGLLAEVQGSIYGTAADAVYDFTACYNAFHDMRKMPAEQFVPRLRRWLHEQHYAETPGLLRLRHVESHDSLRAELWYGIEPMRALMALSAWIDGIPLVYHEMENGHEQEFRHIFAIRQAIPELRRGDVDYLSVEAPPGVFACLRSDGERASIVLVNFGQDKAAGEIRVPLACLPKGLRSVVDVFDADGGDSPLASETTGNMANGNGTLRVVLDPAGLDPHALYLPPLPSKCYKVCLVRVHPSPPPRIPIVFPLNGQTVERAKGQGIAVRATRDEVIELRGDFRQRPYRLLIGEKTGLPESLEYGGRTVLGPADVYLPEKYRRAATAAVFHREGEAIVFERSFGGAKLELRYQDVGGAIRLHSQWTGTDLPENASLAIPMVDAPQWWADTPEGFCTSSYRVRHAASEGFSGHIYWRPQGTNVLWDSLVHPLGYLGLSSDVGTTPSDDGVSLGGFLRGVVPARVQLLDHLGDRSELTALIAWRDLAAPAAPQTPAFDLSMILGYGPIHGPGESNDPGDWHIRPAPGGWIFENDYYALRLSRSGLITQLYAKEPAGKKPGEGDRDTMVSGGMPSPLTPDPSPAKGRGEMSTPSRFAAKRSGEGKRLIVDNADLYTDHGFTLEKIRDAASNEVEAGSRMWKDEQGHLRFRFEGRLRGFYRFDLLKPPLEYFFDYTLDDKSPSFRMSWGIRPHAAPVGKSAFLGLLVPLPDVGRATYRLGGKVVNASGGVSPVRDGDTGKVPVPPGRGWQFRSLGPGIVPDRIDLAGEGGPLLQVSELRCGGIPLSNGFVNGKQFFLTFYDGPPSAEGQGQWRWASAVWTPGSAAPVAIGDPPPPPAKAVTAAILEDPGFEETTASQPVSLRTGQPLPGAQTTCAWTIPVGGKLVAAPVHSGQSAAEVVNTRGEYLLWRQPLVAARFASASRWRLSAWVKGEAIRPGNAGWKVGVLRFAVAGGRTQYVSCPPLSGTFDWRRVSVDLTIPAAMQGLAVEAGLNGATGKMWIDDVALKRIEE